MFDLFVKEFSATWSSSSLSDGEETHPKNVFEAASTGSELDIV